MSYTERVVAYVTRERDGRRELLVFDHRDEPAAGTQVPAGRLEAGEELEPGLLRELHEEAGLADARIVRKLGEWDGAELGHGVGLHNHAFEVEAPGAPDAWEHTVFGDGDDAGCVPLPVGAAYARAAALARARPGGPRALLATGSIGSRRSPS